MKRWMVLAVFQVAAMLGWAAHNESVRATAPTFRIPLEPVDPYDVLRGRYFVMNPKDSWIRTGAKGVLLTREEIQRFLGPEESFADVAQVGFCPQGETFRICRLARWGARPAGDGVRYWSRASLSIRWESTTWREGKEVSDPAYRVRVDLALDRFFLPNRLVLPAPENEPGWEVEVSHRPGLTPLPRRLLFRGTSVVGD